MVNNDKEIKLTDIFDLHFLQQMQDCFAKAVGVASITVDKNGPVTKPSNFTEMCIKYTRGTKEGYNRCNECDIKWGRIAAIKGEPIVYTCHSGLTDFAVPIIVESQHIGSILGGQVLSEQPNEAHFRQVAKELGLNQDEYIDALRKIKIIPESNIMAAAELLFLGAKMISEIGHKNLELTKIHNQENLYRKIIEIIRSSLDVKETEQNIVEIIGETLETDRCFITEYDEINNVFSPIEAEYLSSPEIKSYKGINLNLSLPTFSETLKKGKPVIVNNRKIYIDGENHNLEPEKNVFEKYNINSIFAFPLFYEHNLLGILSIHYVNKQKYISNDDISIITIISNQIAIAIYQSKLYKEIQLKNQREKINRSIIEILRSSLEKETIERLFVENIGKYFNANRVFFSEYDSETSTFLAVEPHAEFLSSQNEKSFVGFNWANPDYKEYIQPLLEKKEFKITELNSFKQNNPNYSKIFYDLFESADVKSSYNLPVLYQQDIMGYFCIEFTKIPVILSNKDIKSIRNICTQAGIALHHSKLFSRVESSANTKEIFISNISSELKMPINELNNKIKIISEIETDNESLENNLEKIKVLADELKDIRSDIITISHIESGNFKLNITPVNLNEIISETLKSLTKESTKNNFKITTDITQDITINADKEMLRLSLYNILHNILKTIRANSKIHILARIENRQAVVSVEINEEGINLDEQNVIFAKYKTIDTFYSKPLQNSELELLITKKLIKQHKGNIAVESTPTNGTEIKITLPVSNH